MSGHHQYRCHWAINVTCLRRIIFCVLLFPSWLHSSIDLPATCKWTVVTTISSIRPRQHHWNAITLTDSLRDLELKIRMMATMADHSCWHVLPKIGDSNMAVISLPVRLPVNMTYFSIDNHLNCYPLSRYIMTYGANSHCDQRWCWQPLVSLTRNKHSFIPKKNMVCEL